MNCIKCNKEFEDGAKFCTHCGAEQKSDEQKTPTVINVTPVAKGKAEKKESKKSDKKSESATLPEQKDKKSEKKADKKANAPAKSEKKSKAEKKVKEPKATEVKEKKEKEPKSKDRVNFFLLLLTLLCPPYFGVLITVCSSAKAPKATQVYGIFTILSFIFMKVKNYVLTAVATILVIVGAIAALLGGAYLVATELGYDITFITDFVSSYLNF